MCFAHSTGETDTETRRERNRMTSVLVVDDEDFLVDLYTEILILNGYVIAGVAHDGEEALKKFTKANPRPDIIIMDNRMPVMSGLDALKAIILLNPTQKVMFVSADVSIEADARAIGALEFMTKPFSLSNLLEKLKHLSEDGRTRPPGRDSP